MPFFTRPNFEDRQQVQYSGNTISLSGKTHINSTGYLQINAPVLDFTGSTSASTQYILAGLSGYRNYGELTSLIVKPPIQLISGTSATTTVNVTGYILGGLDAQGHVSWFPASYFLTGGTSGGGSGTTYVYVQFTGNTSGDCITDMWVSNIHSCGLAPASLHIQPVNTNPVLIGENGAHVAIGSPSFNPQTILHLKGEGTGMFNTFRITSSASLDHLDVTDNGQFTWDNTASLVIRTGVTITIETGPVAGYVLTSDTFGGATWQPAPSGTGTTIVQFTGNTSASCITDLYVHNLYGCSPINVKDSLVMGSNKIIQSLGTTSQLALNDDSLLLDTESGTTTGFHLAMSKNPFGGQLNVGHGFTNVITVFEPSISIPGGGVSILGGDYVAASSTSLQFQGSSYAFLKGDAYSFLGGSGIEGDIIVADNTGLDTQSKDNRPTAGSFISAQNATIRSGSNNSAVLGGYGLTAFTANTIYLGNSVNINNKFTLPNIDGTVGQVMTTNGAGIVTWQTVASGSGGTGVISGMTSPYIFGPNTYDIVTLSGNNFTLSNRALVLGGLSNIVQGIASSIINGQSNTITGSPRSTIVNGTTHLISNSANSTIINGLTNTIDGPIFPSTYSLIGGGSTNIITNSRYSLIGNGFGNDITVLGILGGWNSILNGESNSISAAVNFSTILGGTNNTVNYTYSTIVGGTSNIAANPNTFILGSNITTTTPDTTYTEKVVAGASSVNAYVGHLNVNDYNTYGPIRPNFITELLTSGNTTGGTYNIYIPSGWTVTDIQVYTKTTDLSIFGASVGTIGGIWSPSGWTGFIPTHNIITLFRTTLENGPHYFPNPDLATIYFVDVGASPQALTTGEYKVLITYWNNLELAL